MTWLRLIHHQLLFGHRKVRLILHFPIIYRYQVLDLPKLGVVRIVSRQSQGLQRLLPLSLFRPMSYRVMALNSTASPNRQ